MTQQLALFPTSADPTVALPLRSQLGGVHTPAVLAEWVASELLGHMGYPYSPLILDPACGDGALLAAVAEVSEGRARLIGRDIDSRVLEDARAILGDTAVLELSDSLLLSDTLPADDGPAGIFANPPWGSTVLQPRALLRTLGYELARGQFDIFELFVEHLLKTCPDGTVMGFILPDSVLLPEHAELRRLLLRSTELLLIARLGEGIFPGIYRATIVIIFRAGPPPPTHQVECFRLGPRERKDVHAGRLALKEAQRLKSHHVLQTRFLQNPSAEFNLDVRSGETAVEKMLSVDSFRWDQWTAGGRGVEIGKSGATLQCPLCGRYRPVPNTRSSVRCSGCHYQFSGDEPITRIIQPNRRSTSANRAWRPLIVGEDVQRYYSRHSREIRSELPGLRSPPPDQIAQPKLLVRKTGIGLRAAIDESGASTVQTVFHFVLRGEAPIFLLDYLLGVLNSRVLLAFQIRWSGDNEWRSHPYVTKKTIIALPIPDPFANQFNLIQAREIANTAEEVRKHELKPDSDADLRVDCLVAGLYRLTDSECAWVGTVLDEAQTLQPISSLRFSPGQLVPSLAAW